MFKHFISLFSPNICPLCYSAMKLNDSIFCFICLEELPKTNFHLHPTDNKITDIFKGRVEIENGLAFYYYSKGLKTQKLIHLLKYKNKPEVGYEVGRIYGNELKEHNFNHKFDAIIPVPLHLKKLKIRGYNQSEVFARGLSETSGISLDLTSLQRIAFTETQTKKSRFKRWDNVKEKFQLIEPEQIKNKHIVLVDDVITTGSTLESCINELQKAEGVKISVLSMSLASN